jgi:predicted component of type VI protein secretion system
MTTPNTSREYLFSDELKRELEVLIERSEARLQAARARREKRRRSLRRLSFGLLGR